MAGAAVLPAGLLIARSSFSNPLSVAPAVKASFLNEGDIPPVVSMLGQAAERAGRRFGAALRPEHLADRNLRELTVANCATVTPEIHLKWNSLEWKPGEFNYAPVDELLTFCSAHGLSMRGHTLIWERSTPDWAKAEISERRDWRTVAGHFERTLGRYARRVRDWDVVNEPIDTEAGDGRGLRRTVFHDAFGADYVELALHEARSHAPDARLMINDYGFEYLNSTEVERRRAMLRLLERLRADGAPLDGVGLQAHLDMSKGPLASQDLRGFVREIAAMGLEIHITELDVKESDRTSPIRARDSEVADAARRYLDVVLDEPAVRAVTTWGLSDRYSWLSEGDGNGGPAAPGKAVPFNRGLPFDNSLAPKSLYYALAKSLLVHA